MNIDNAITTELKGDGDKVYLDFASQEATPPYFVWFHVGGFDDMTLAGPSGSSETLIQLDAWAPTAEIAKAMIDRGVSKLQQSDRFDVQSVDVSGAPPFDFDTTLHRRSREVRIWYQP